jgi:hypothetical protein
MKMVKVMAEWVIAFVIIFEIVGRVVLAVDALHDKIKEKKVRQFRETVDPRPVFLHRYSKMDVPVR